MIISKPSHEIETKKKYIANGSRKKIKTDHTDKPTPQI